MRLTSIALAVAIALGVFAWVTTGPDAQTGAETGEAAASGVGAGARAPVSVLARKSAARDLERSLTLRGRTEAVRKVELRAQTSGLVVSEPRRAGAEVAAGEALCEIEAGARAAELAMAKAKLAQAEADADASRQLSRKGFSAETKLAADIAALEAARAEIDRIELDIARTRVAAPFAGLLESDAAETGSLLNDGDVCATLVALDPIKVIGYAPENRVSELRAGQPAAARLITGERIEAIVTFVARSADTATRTFRVEATAANPGGAIRDGVTAEITLPLETRRAHLAPASALTLDAAGRLGVRVVETAADDALVARFQPVEVLRQDADGVWLSGLAENVDLIVVGQEFVNDGAPVAPSYEGLAAAGEGAR